MSDQSIKESARLAALKKVYQSYFETLLRNGNFEDYSDLPEDVEALKRLKDMCNTTDPDLQDFTHVWLTVTPEEQHGYDKDPEKLAKFCKSWLDKSTMVEEYTFNIEQRSETLKGAGKGTHAHILITRKDGKSYAEYNQNIKRKFGPMHGTNFKFFGANKTGSTYYKGSDFAAKKIEYLNGTKEGKHKQLMVSVDRHWRDCHELQQIYKHTDICDP